jgi:WNK lysine deficient protein kinase
MVTQERPYAECINPAQIYRKVVSGEAPGSLLRVKDVEVLEFIIKCTSCNPKDRPTCQQLLESDFLKDIDNEKNK